MRKRVIILSEKIINKLRDRSGESIAETLVSMLIVVLAFTMLSGAIIASARVNASTENLTMYINQADGSSGSISDNSGTVTVTKGSGGDPIDTFSGVKEYRMNGSSGILYYYE